MKYLSLALASLAVPLILGGCDSDPARTEVHAEAFLRALAVAPETSVIHRGGADYSGGTKSHTHRKIQVSSGDPEAGTTVHLQMLSASPQRIEDLLGQFPLVPRNFVGGDNDGKTALYFRDGKHYVAENGTLTITDAWGDMGGVGSPANSSSPPSTGAHRRPIVTRAWRFPRNSPRARRGSTSAASSSLCRPRPRNAFFRSFR